MSDHKNSTDYSNDATLRNTKATWFDTQLRSAYTEVQRLLYRNTIADIPSTKSRDLSKSKGDGEGAYNY